MKEFFIADGKQLILATIMGAMAMTIRNIGFYVPILEPFKLDPRWVFSILAACWTGPLGGLISGGLAAFKLPYPRIDLACIPVHFVIGLVARWLTIHNKQHLLACSLWPILGVPAYWLSTLLFLPTANAVIVVPILSFIGVSSAILSFLVGFAVEKRVKFIRGFLQVRETAPEPY